MNVFALTLISLLLASPCVVLAQDEIALLSPGSLEPEMGKLVPAWESKTGRKVKVTIAAGGINKQTVVRGEPAYDVVILQPPYPEVLASGNVVNASATPLASVALGAVVRKGAPVPDFSTAEAVKRALLAAKSISYTEEAGGTSALAFKKVLEKLGITEQVQPKFKLAQTGGVMAIVARGEAEMAVTFMSGMNQPGIEVIGPFPSELSPPTQFVGFVGARAKDPAAAKAILEYLSSPEAGAVYKIRRMVPAR